MPLKISSVVQKCASAHDRDMDIPLYCIISPTAPMDYSHVNITELVYTEEQDQVTFDITIVDDGDDDEIIEEFHLNVIPVDDAVISPRITVGICTSKIAYQKINDVITIIIVFSFWN